MEEQLVEIPKIYVLMQKKGAVWEICQHIGSSTRKAPMIYDTITSARRARGRVPDSEIIVISSQKGEILDA